MRNAFAGVSVVGRPGVAAAILSVVAVLAGAVAADREAAAQSQLDPLRVYVVVLDGLRPQEVTPQLMPNLAELRAQGTWYEQARSVFIAETLPNHVAMMTGVAPGRGGVVSNDYWQPNEFGAQRYRMDDPALLDSDTLMTRIENRCPDVASANVMSKTYLWSVFRPEAPRAGDPNPQRGADYHWNPQSSDLYIGKPDEHTPDSGTWTQGFLPWYRNTSYPRQFAFLNLGDIDRVGHVDQTAAATDGGLTGARLAALEDSDALLGQWVDELKAGGAWDDSVVIFTSDHGMDWGLQTQTYAPATTLSNAGYNIDSTGAPGKNSGGEGDFALADGGASAIIYAEESEDVADMATVLADDPAVRFVATRESIPGLGNPTHADVGLDDPHRRAGDIVVFVKPGWSIYGGLPGNHGHPATQQQTLLVAGGHEVLDDVPQSVGGETVFDEQLKPNGSNPAAGPGNLSIAPTVAALLGLGEPPGGYDGQPLTEAFDGYALAPHEPCQPADPAAAAPRLAAGDVSVTEGDAGSRDAVFTVTLSTPFSEPVTVDYATANGTAGADDVDPRSGTLTFAAGETAKTVSVPVRGDTADEPDETFELRLSEPGAGATLPDPAATGTIVDDDGAGGGQEPTDTPSVSVGDVSVSEGDAGSRDAAFAITLSAPATRTVEVRHATADGTATTAGGDYDARVGTLSFAPGQTTATALVPVRGDGVDEPDETFTLKLSEPSGATGGDMEARATIADDDEPGPAPTLSVSGPTVSEGDEGARDAVFDIRLSRSHTTAVQVAYATGDSTATAADGDYAARSGALTFAPGETGKSVAVPVRGDRSDEPDERFTLALSEPSGAGIATGIASATIVDDDEPAPAAPRAQEHADAHPPSRSTAASGGGAPCATSAVVVGARIALGGRRVALSVRRGDRRPARIDVFQVSEGRRVIGERLVARFGAARGSVVWDGAASRRGRAVGDGWFVVRFRMTDAFGRAEVRRVALRRDGGRFSVGPAFDDRGPCGSILSFKLERPVFGGPANGDLGVSYVLAQPARARIEVLRGRRVVERRPAAERAAGELHRVRFDAEGRPPGEYRVRLVVERAGRTTARTLVAQRL